MHSGLWKLVIFRCWTTKCVLGVRMRIMVKSYHAKSANPSNTKDLLKPCFSILWNKFSLNCSWKLFIFKELYFYAIHIFHLRRPNRRIKLISAATFTIATTKCIITHKIYTAVHKPAGEIIFKLSYSLSKWILHEMCVCYLKCFLD